MTEAISMPLIVRIAARARMSGLACSVGDAAAGMVNSRARMGKSMDETDGRTDIPPMREMRKKAGIRAARANAARA
jgi:hypothetical protein